MIEFKETSPNKMYIINNAHIYPETKICRYMDFDNFLQILEGKFYVPRKKMFLDHRESGSFPIKNRFTYNIVGGDWNEPESAIRQKKTDLDSYLDQLIKSQFLLTSCWTLDNGENYLMWKSYTGNMGVCVRTTIDKLMSAIDFDKEKDIVVCSNMFYDTINTSNNFLETMYKKDIFYRSEDEIRFYFVPNRQSISPNLINNDVVFQLLLSSAINEEKLYRKDSSKYVMNKIYDICPRFIDSIVISPFITNKVCVRHLFKKCFGDIFVKDTMIIDSEIII